MSNHDDQKEMDSQETKESFQFMNQTIKEKPVDRKKQIKQILYVLGLAVMAGIIGGLVFAGTVSATGKLNQDKPVESKVSIPLDDDPTATVVTESDSTSTSISDSSAASSVQVDSGENSKSAEETDAPVTPTQSSDTESGTETITEDNSSTQVYSGIMDGDTLLQNYKYLHRELLNIADSCKAYMVQVTGITNEMDYFNQTYEDSRQISGVIVAENEENIYVLTEYYVLENVERIQVTFVDESSVDALFVRQDADTGLAVIRVPLSSISADTLSAITVAELGNSYVLSQGEPVLAIGSPLGYNDSVTFGMVTSLNQTYSAVDVEYRLLMTDLDGRADGSGIFVNLDGEVVGVLAKNVRVEGAGLNGLAISEIKTLIETLSNNEPRARLGIHGQDVTTTVTEKTGIPQGLLVTAIESDSPAMLSGIMEYDVIIAIQDDKISGMHTYEQALRKITPGDTIEIVVMRKGTEGYVEVTFSAQTGEI